MCISLYGHSCNVRLTRGISRSKGSRGNLLSLGKGKLDFLESVMKGLCQGNKQ